MSKNIKSTQSPHKLVLYLSVIKLRKMICPQHFYNIFITNSKWQVVTSCYCRDKKVILMLGSNLN